jgi:hypothetical protein
LPGSASYRPPVASASKTASAAREVFECESHRFEKNGDLVRRRGERTRMRAPCEIGKVGWQWQMLPRSPRWQARAKRGVAAFGESALAAVDDDQVGARDRPRVVRLAHARN